MSNTQELSPGSLKAREAGCICPVMDNSYGKGYMGGVKDSDGNTVYVIVVGCPIHHPNTEVNDEQKTSS